MADRDYKPFLEVSEETIIRFRTDLGGLAIIRQALQELASSPRGLDPDDETGDVARDAEEMLVLMPGAGGGRRSPEAKLRGSIEAERVVRRDVTKTADIQRSIIAIIEKELPDVVAAAREKAHGREPVVTDETAPPSAAPAAPSAPPVDPSAAAE